MQVRRVLALSSPSVTVSVAAASALRSANNDNNKQPPRSARNRQDIQALVDRRVAPRCRRGVHDRRARCAAAGDSADCQAADAGRTDQLARATCHQVGLEPLRERPDGYLHSVHAAARSWRLPSGAALWIRVVTADQAAAFAAMVTARRGAGQQEPAGAPARTVRVGQRAVSSTSRRAASCRARSSSSPASTWPSSRSRKRAPRRLAISANDRNRNDKNRRLRPLRGRSACCVTRSRCRTSTAAI